MRLPKSMRWVGRKLQCCIVLFICMTFAVIVLLALNLHHIEISNYMLNVQKEHNIKSLYQAKFNYHYNNINKRSGQQQSSAAAHEPILNDRFYNLSSLVFPLYEVLKLDGIDVFKESSLNANVIYSLPYKSIVIGSLNAKTFSIIFPLRGFLNLEFTQHLQRYQFPPLLSSQLSCHPGPYNSQNLKLTKCRNMIHLNYTDILNSDLTSLPKTNKNGIHSINDCCRACRHTRSCNAFTYIDSSNLPTVPGQESSDINTKCWLKKFIPGISAIIQVQHPPQQQRQQQQQNQRQWSKPQQQPKLPQITSSILLERSMWNHPAQTLSMIKAVNTKPQTCCSDASHSERGKHETHQQQSVPYSYTLHNRYRADAQSPSSVAEWDRQWPIGNGRAGALVGGGVSAEVIPLSVAGLFSHRLTPPATGQESGAGAAGTASNDAKVPATTNSKAVGGVIFRQARELLKAGHAEASEQLMSTLQESTPLGMFEYAADLLLVYSKDPIQFHDIVPQPPVQQQRQPPLQQQQQNVFSGLEMQFYGRGRKALINQLKSTLNMTRTDTDSGTDQAGGGKRQQVDCSSESVAATDSEATYILDMKHGTVSNTLVERRVTLSTTAAGAAAADQSASQKQPDDDEISDYPSSPPAAGTEDSSVADAVNRTSATGAAAAGGEAESVVTVQVHHREWFASIEEDVIVGHLSCLLLPAQHQLVANSHTQTTGEPTTTATNNTAATLNVENIDSSQSHDSCLNVHIGLFRDRHDLDEAGRAVAPTTDSVIRDIPVLSDTDPVSSHQTHTRKQQQASAASGVAGDESVFNIARRFTRDMMKSVVHANRSEGSSKGSGIASEVVKAYAFDLSLSSSALLAVPTTHLCALMFCQFNSTNSSIAESNGSVNSRWSHRQSVDIPVSSVICNGAHTVSVVLSVQIDAKENNSSTHGAASTDSGDVAGHFQSSDAAYQRQQCWTVLERASLRGGLDALKQRHRAHFAERMTRTDIQFGNTDEDALPMSGDESTSERNRGGAVRGTVTVSAGSRDQCLMGSPLQARLTELGEHCPAAVRGSRAVSTDGGSASDASLLSLAFQYSRYLLLSGGSHSVMNLQGIWADGVTSAWNGDYHLNINLQEMYWTVDSTQVSEAFPPLLHFLERMALAGRTAATRMYGSHKHSDSWVSHGFVDNYLSSGLSGDPQWSLCVTCGAWVVAQVWEHFTYSATTDFDLLLLRLMPVMRGALHFFLEYMWEDASGVMHTGPTTSPENSFEMLMTQKLAKIAAANTAAAYAAAAAAAVDDYAAGTGAEMNVRPQPPQQQQQQQPVLRNSIQEMQKRQEDMQAILDANVYRQQQKQKQVKGSRRLVAAAGVGVLSNLRSANNRLRIQSFQQQQQMPPPQLPRQFQYVTFSPAIDISILRQLANAFSLSVEWLRRERAQAYASYESDKSLAEAFVRLIYKMPNHAVPVTATEAAAVSPTAGASVSVISEYPYHSQHNSAINNNSNSNSNNNNDISNIHFSESSFGFDAGHRHFSPMHANHPGLFAPGFTHQYSLDLDEELLLDSSSSSSNSNGNRNSIKRGSSSSSSSNMKSSSTYSELSTASKNFMALKGSHSGGHTSWSAAWQACIHARLFSADEAFRSIHQLLKKYTASNLFSLHPNLSKKSMHIEDRNKQSAQHKTDNRSPITPNRGQVTSIDNCKTCYEEDGVSLSRQSSASDMTVSGLQRGLVSDASDKFHLDGNVGVAAALVEMLMQSHIPGTLILLPALPSKQVAPAMQAGLRARGDVEVSFRWEKSYVNKVTIIFFSYHPWLRGIVERSEKSFDANNKPAKSEHLMDRTETGFVTMKNSYDDSKFKNHSGVIYRLISPQPHGYYLSYARNSKKATVNCASLVSGNSFKPQLLASLSSAYVSTVVHVHTFPCTLELGSKSKIIF